jgi:hypothetical protein
MSHYRKQLAMTKRADGRSIKNATKPADEGFLR